jgi:hypothetical protein
MTPAQREAAERLADWHEAYAWHCDSDATTVPGRDGNRRNVSHREAAALLRELLAEPQGEPDGWLEAAVAWEVCASIHQTWAKGKDALFTTRHADFVRHADDARRKHAAVSANRSNGEHHDRTL